MRAWLAAHPEAQAEWAADTALGMLLDRLPDAPMPSNFTARIMQAVEQEQAARKRTRETPSPRWWRGLLPRAAVTIAVVGLALFTYQRHESARRAELARSLTAVAEVQSLPSPQALADYEAIRRLSPAPVADEELLALLQ